MCQFRAFVYSQPFFVFSIKRDVSFQTDESKLSDFELKRQCQIKAYDILQRRRRRGVARALHRYYEGGGARQIFIVISFWLKQGRLV